MDYTVRCQALLQAGKPVVDIAVWTGDDYPRRAVRPERLVPLLPGVFGKERVEAEAARLAADPMERDTSACGVVYPKNATLSQDWINPMHGYHYDSFNTDALIACVKGSKGRISLPGGMEYSALIVPPADIHYPNGILLKRSARALRSLKRAGVPVLDSFPYEDTDLSALGIEPDFIASDDRGVYVEGLNFCHRRTDAEDIYFVANHDGAAKSFRVSGRTPEIWYPASGEIVRETSFREEKGRVIMPLLLEASESVFIVLKDDSKVSVLGDNSLHAETITDIAGPWTVDFRFRGKEKRVNFDKLSDWKDNRDPFIRYFSGTAEYNTTFEAPETDGARCWLEFDRICNIAEIIVNGRSCGTLWTPPYRIDVTDALQTGTNTLTIRVANTWGNHMKGAHEGKIKADGFWTLVPYWTDVPLQESGIIGNVRLLKSGVICFL